MSTWIETRRNVIKRVGKRMEGRARYFFDLTERTELFKFKFRFEIAGNNVFIRRRNFARGARRNITSPFLCRAGRLQGKDGETS